MDAAWLILDSLSYDATPFAEDGPDTMPGLKALAKSHGVVFTNAYVPGPTSPSSHGSFFTGELPSVTGMHEANPNFSANIDTIGDFLKDSHRTFAISANPFIFNGLCDSFDVKDDLSNPNVVLFDEGSNPMMQDTDTNQESRLRRYLQFLFMRGKPVRSLLNGLYFKSNLKLRGGDFTKRNEKDEQMGQYAETMNADIRKFFSSTEESSFTVANYMDIHAPLDASDQAIDRFAPKHTHEDLPINIRGQEVHEKVINGNEDIGEKMYKLYKAAIWDLDSKITPLIEELLEQDVFVVVTSDHGNWFRRERELEEQRIHVPLVIFAPNEEQRTVSHSVNIRALPRTTAEMLKGTTGGFSGYNLLKTNEDKLSVTELIHDPNQPGSPVNPYGIDDATVRRDITAVLGQSRVDYIDSSYNTIRGAEDKTEHLRDHLGQLIAEGYKNSDGEKSENSDHEDRLRALGYLE